jgi:uncharacterized delta-60 repeat protein
VRLRTDGSYDTTFSGNGMRVARPSNTEWASASAVAIDGSGRIVFGGTGFFQIDTNHWMTRPIVSRLLANGTADTTFAGDGTTPVVYKFGQLTMTSLALDAQGRVLIGGTVEDKAKYAIARLNTDGRLDQTFGFDGVADARFETAYSARGNALALDRTGHAFVVGDAVVGTGTQIGVAAFLLDHLSVRAWPELTATMGSQKVSSLWVYRHPSLDVALISLAAPLSISGNSTTWQFGGFYGDSVASLQGKTALCAGYGNTDKASTTGFGTLRTANLPITDTSSTEITLLPNSREQIIANGDSGGPCYAKDATGAYKLAGVASWISLSGGEIETGHDVAAPSFSAWVKSMRGF